MDSYLFPAIFEPREGKGYSLTFPDIPSCTSKGNDLAESIDKAREVLKIHLHRMKDNGLVIPYPTPLDIMDAPEGGFATVIEVLV